MKHSPALLLLAGLLGCTTPEATAPPSANEVVLALGESAALGGSGITVRVQAIDDSRCPTTLVCVWEGNGRVTVELTDGSGVEASAPLNTHPSYQHAVVFRYLRIELSELDPWPKYATANRVDYRAHLRWSYLPD